MKIDSMSSHKDSFALLRRQRGFTLIETVAVAAVIALLVITIYIGVVYAEKQLLTNYRDRVATLLLAGELDMEYYRHSRSKPFELQLNKEYILDDRDPDYILRGSMTIELKNAQETSNEQLFNYRILEARMTWIDTATQKPRVITMREDYFIP
ncbi:MAG: prepilin-type N-terminal cleavage/methylation domain-containing protein [Candidatus Cloacimonadaceae bacterium]|jgi:prepilin-type N-terminal cleavage/methylation domain-containing protein|nr:prepilin-type N-terminal cleavage/methylation domain-containing protein [Candidatus Cloacimonadota bacterium]MDX9949287.1 prepilin-type N-terminal cleavage/methylation domain-containing protein [Candidatus Syntrophosphaera sp.]NLN85470.1 prepilin-type N-terminal cleavage/methylation domain-containing protein [Candidatus Cloacimonadota bacterium]